MISFTCPSCQKTFTVADELLGKKVRCPACMNISYIAAQPPHVPQPDYDQLFGISQPASYAKPNTKYCHHCGVSSASLAEICPKCGVRQPDLPDSRAKKPTDEPNKIAACLFAILLGLFGAHKFYLGQPMWGVLYLLLTILLWWTGIVVIILAIICLIEGLLYLTYTDAGFAEKYGRHE